MKKNNSKKEKKSNSNINKIIYHMTSLLFGGERHVIKIVWPHV